MAGRQASPSAKVIDEAERETYPSRPATRQSDCDTKGTVALRQQFATKLARMTL
jgi:hypothetical protein